MMNKIASVLISTIVVIGALVFIFLILPLISFLFFFIVIGIIILGMIWFIAEAIQEEWDDTE